MVKYLVENKPTVIASKQDGSNRRITETYLLKCPKYFDVNGKAFVTYEFKDEEVNAVKGSHELKFDWDHVVEITVDWNNGTSTFGKEDLTKEND